jgi:hypothetical protein
LTFELAGSPEGLRYVQEAPLSRAALKGYVQEAPLSRAALKGHVQEAPL